jgi:hypothetical protein
MATPIDELVIQIKADTKQLQKDLDQIKGKLKTTGTAGAASFAGATAASGALAGSLKRLAGPVAVGAVVVAMGKLTAFSLRAGMEFEDLKDSLDTVFGSIQAGDKQFDRILRFAQTTPFQIDTVTKAFISLGSVGIEPTSRMMQVFADTASVAVDQRGAFEALIRVVQRAEAGALGLQELNMLADRGIDVFKGLKDELGLSRLELTDFGQTAGGAKIIVESLVTVLEKQFGGAMVAKMDNLSVAVSNLQIAFKSLGNEIFESGVGNFFKDIVAQATGAVNAMAVAIAATSGRGLGITLDAPVMTTEMNFEQMQAERQRTALRNIDAIKAKLTELANIEPDKGFFEKIFEGFSANQGMSFDLIGVSNQMMEEFGINAEDAAKMVVNLNKELEAQNVNLENSLKTQTVLNEEDKKALLIKGKNVRAFGLLQKSIEDAKGDTELFTHAQTQLKQIFEENSAFLKDNGIPDAKALGEAFKDLETEANDLAGNFMDTLAPAIQSLSLSFTKEFVDALLDGKNALESFKNFARNIVSQIIATFMQMAVVNQILNSVFNLSGANALPTINPFGSGASTSSGGSGGRGMGSFASGGRVRGGSPVLVGERGAEIFVPNSGGTIMNNMNSKNAMSSGSPIIVNQSVNFATGVVPTVRAEVVKMMPQIADVTKGAVAEAAMRGGNYRRMLQGG